MCCYYYNMGFIQERAFYVEILYTIVQDRKKVFGLFQIPNSGLKIKGATLAGAKQNNNMLKQQVRLNTLDQKTLQKSDK